MMHCSDFLNRRRFLVQAVALAAGGGALAAQAAPAEGKPNIRTPKLVDEWIPIALSPDLPEIDSKPGGVVDHAIFRAANGKWQLWMQIRDTAVGRLFYRWEGGESLAQSKWTPRGICWRADRASGESQQPGKEEWIHAPHVMREGKQYIMYYGGGMSEHSGAQISVATSSDGITFTRVKDKNGHTEVCAGPGYARDPMVLPVGNEYIMYYAADEEGKGVIAARTSPRAIGAPWSEYRVVSEGGFCGSGRSDQQCPYVVSRDGLYYLFKMGLSNRYETAVYWSKDPLDFGKDDEQLVCVLESSASEVIEADGGFYLSSLIPGYKGVRIRRMEW